MSGVKEHYDKHLGNFYTWMSGDFHTNQEEFLHHLRELLLFPQGNGAALDLGAGHGIQAVALARSGYTVKAVDFNLQLLSELRQHAQGLPVEAIEGDILEVKSYVSPPPELVICWGDTLTHLPSRQEVVRFLQDICEVLAAPGRLLLSFRDYSQPLEGDSRFIPVKSDNQRILTCFLEYEPEFVRVTDLLHEKAEEGWMQKVSSYTKVRITPAEVVSVIESMGLKVAHQDLLRGLVRIVAQKG